MSYQQVKTWRQKTKRILIQAFGDKCCICGYSKCSASLVFHHIDPKSKRFELNGKLGVNLSNILEESKKCIMVCSNCHGEIHAKLVSIPENVTAVNEAHIRRHIVVRIPRLKGVNACPICGKNKLAWKKVCSLSCAGKSSGGHNKFVLSKDIVLLKQKLKTYTAVARQLHVSRKTVAKCLIALVAQ